MPFLLLEGRCPIFVRENDTMVLSTINNIAVGFNCFEDMYGSTPRVGALVKSCLLVHFCKSVHDEDSDRARETITTVLLLLEASELSIHLPNRRSYAPRRRRKPLKLPPQLPQPCLSSSSGLSIRDLPLLRALPLLHTHGHVLLHGHLGDEHPRRRRGGLGANHGSEVPHGEWRTIENRGTSRAAVPQVHIEWLPSYPRLYYLQE